MTLLSICIFITNVYLLKVILRQELLCFFLVVMELFCPPSAPSRNHRIVLNFTFMETECTYDYLFVYDGDSYQSPLLASLSGTTLPQPIEAKSGKVRPKVYVYTICSLEPVSLTFQRIKNLPFL